MRRIYDSGALDRDDRDPFRPNESDATVKPEAMRTVPGGTLSRALLPQWLRHRCIRVSVTTPQSTYPAGAPIQFAVTMRNRMPFPVSIETRSPERWIWSVDGHPSASHISRNAPPDEPSTLTFDRGERKHFPKRWNQMFRTSREQWEPAEPGEYRIAAWINVSAPERRGLADDVTVRIAAEP